MKVLIIADKRIDGLLQLTGDVASGLLPVAGKPLAEYVVESICSTKRADGITWICGNYMSGYRKTFGNGERWGVEMTYETNLQEMDSPCLILRADTLLDLDLNDFINLIDQNPDKPYCGITGQLAGIYWAPDRVHVMEVLKSNLSVHWQYRNFAKGNSIKINSAQTFHDANMLILHNQLTYQIVDPFQRGKKMVCGARTKVHPDVLKSGKAYIGSRTEIDHEAAIVGDTVVGNDVVIEAHAVLNNAIVFPFTYVGEWVELNNVIVKGNMLYKIDSGVCIKVNETFLLRDLKSS